MSRTVSSAIRSAITGPASYRVNAKLRVYASRHYFGLTDYGDYEYAGIESWESVDPLFPVPESSAWNTSTESLNTVFSFNGKLKGGRQGYSTPMDLKIIGGSTELNVDEYEISRPAILGDSIYWWDGSNWKTATYDHDLWVAGTEACINTPSTYVAGASVPVGAIYPLGSGEAIILYVDDGGVRAAYIDTYGNVHKSDGRFMDPNHILQSSADFSVYLTADEEEVVKLDCYRVHYGGAAKWTDSATGNTRIYAYYTAYDGSVLGTYFEWTAANGDNGIWSEIFIAVPEDLSTFAVGNVFTYNNRVWMIGKFTRRSDFASTSTYTLLIWSDDGKTFTMDRRSLVTTIDERWLVNYDNVNNDIYFSASGHLATVPGAYQMNPTACDYLDYRLDGFSGNVSGGWSCNVVAGAEAGFTYEWLDEGSIAEIFVGVSTGDVGYDPDDEYEWISYQICVIGQVSKTFADGQRAMTISIVPYGLWHSQTMTYPFYMEIQGKQYLFSPMKTLDTLYNQTGDAGQIWALTQDLSTSDNPDGFNVATHAASTTTDHWADDLEVICSSYPEFGEAEDYQIKLYGWSRAGVPGTNPNTPDATPTNTTNDDFYALLLVEDLSGNQSTIVSLIGDLVSDHSNPPQTWFVSGARDGSYPITYTIPNPGNGWKIIKLGVRVISGSIGTTTYFLERIEMPGIAASYIPAATTESGFNLSTFSPVDYLNTYFNPTDLTDTAGITLNQLHLTHHFDWSIFQTAKFAMFQTPNDGISHTYHIQITHNIHESANFGTPDSAREYHNGIYTTAVGQYNAGPPISTGATFIAYDTGVHEWDTTMPPLITTYDGTIGPNLWVFVEGFHINGLSWGSESIDIVIDGFGSQTPDSLPSQAITHEKGVPQILFATTPYSAWNFDVHTRASVKGPYTYAGGLGLGTDKNNFIVGYMKIGYLGIAKVRDGVRTVLYEQAQAGILSDTFYDLRFWHRDGHFGVEYKSTAVTEWPDKDSMLVYDWKKEDGEIAPIAPVAAVDASGLAVSIIDTSEIDAYVFHVGVYAIIDPPKFRTTGFNTQSTYIPVMPLDINPNTGDSDYLTIFPSSGTVDCGGYLFTFTGKNTFMSGKNIEGPFQFRNVVNWNGVLWETDFDDSYHYTGDLAMEFTKFYWQGSSAHHADYNGAILGVSGEDGTLCDDVFFKPWITTGGQVVFLRERSRAYSATMPSSINDSLSMKEQVWITHGLTGVTPAEAFATSASFDKGSFVYIDNDDNVTLRGFMAFSGEDDYNVGMLLDKFCRIAGTSANFPGDIVSASHTFADGGSLAV